MSRLVILLVLLLIVLALALLLGWGLVTFNKLVRQRNQVQASWAQVDVQLRRRHDLIPNLVEAVRGYAAHERTTLDEVIAARNGAVQAHGDAGSVRQADAEQSLGRTVGRLFAVAEAYPQLKADRNFRELQNELVSTEDKIAYARQFFNTAVQTLNTSVQSVPTNIVAGIGGFKEHEYFEATGETRGPVGVRF